MCELSSLSGSSASSPDVIARRRLLRRVPRLDIVVDDVRDAKYEDIARPAPDVCMYPCVEMTLPPEEG